MLVSFDECRGGNLGLFRDIADNRNVVQWLENIINHNVEFKPEICCVAWGQEKFCVVSCYEATENATEVINRIKRLPAERRNMPNDAIEIYADNFERELFIYLDGKKR